VISAQHNIRVCKYFGIALSALAVIDDDIGETVTMSFTNYLMVSSVKL
jgi:hypothetical protein